MSHKIITSTRFILFTLPDRIGIIADTLHIHILPETGLHSYNNPPPINHSYCSKYAGLRQVRPDLRIFVEMDSENDSGCSQGLSGPTFLLSNCSHTLLGLTSFLIGSH